jgi:hypothetical protein
MTDIPSRNRHKEERSISHWSPKVERQIIRVLKAFERVHPTVDIIPKGARKNPGRPGDKRKAAVAYLSQHPNAKNYDVCIACDCGEDTVRNARKILREETS